MSNFAYGYLPSDMLDEIQSSTLPTPTVTHAFFHLIDTDTSYQAQHPDWNFDKTTNFYLTFHNRYESATNQNNFSVPVAENPWHKYHGPGGGALQTTGIPQSTGPDGHPTPGTGTFPWNPGSVAVYLEANVSASLNCEYAAASVGLTSGVSITQNVPSRDVKLGDEGTVYYRILKTRTTFNYKHYLQGGRHIVGFNPDGSETQHKGQVDRPDGGAAFIVWVQQAGSLWPETTTMELDHP